MHWGFSPQTNQTTCLIYRSVKMAQEEVVIFLRHIALFLLQIVFYYVKPFAMEHISNKRLKLGKRSFVDY